ncbi:SET domain-containing protein [Mycena kentingensis (nom. inval.)]|nr:SET domain-containing protein [Mycena kentingensis (nom. inval.)]
MASAPFPIPPAGSLSEIAPTSPLLSSELPPLLDRFQDPGRPKALKKLLDTFHGQKVTTGFPAISVDRLLAIHNAWNSGEDSLRWDGYTIQSGTNKLFFFPEYSHVFKTVNSNLVKRSLDPSQLRIDNFYSPGSIVVGNAGIGKTQFLWFYLSVAVSRQQTILFFTSGCYFLFTKEGVYHFGLGTRLNLLQAPELLDVVLLLDMDWPITQSNPVTLNESMPLRVVGASSPQEARYDHTVEHAKIKLAAMDTPTRDEVAAFFLSTRPYAANMPKDAFGTALYMGIRLLGLCVRDLEIFIEDTIRTSLTQALEGATDVVASAMKTLGLLSEDAFKQIIYQGRHRSKDATHKLVAMRRRRDDSISSGFYHCARSRYVLRNLALAAIYSSRAATNALFALFKTVPQTSFAREWAYEFLAHENLGLRATDINIQFEHGASRTICVGNGEKLPYKWDDTQREDFEIGVYYIPSRANNIAFDSFIFHRTDDTVSTPVRLYAFQTTIAPTQQVLHCGLAKLRQIKRLFKSRNGAIPLDTKTYFVFVVPDASQFRIHSVISRRQNFEFGVANVPIEAAYTSAYREMFHESNPPPVAYNVMDGDELEVEDD